MFKPTWEYYWALEVMKCSTDSHCAFCSSALFFLNCPKSPQAALTEYHRLGSLNSISHSCGAWKPRVKVLAQSGSGEASLPSLQLVAFSRCPHSLSLSASSISSSCKDTTPITLGPHPRTSFNLRYLLQRPLPGYSCPGDWEFNLRNLGGKIQFIAVTVNLAANIS